MSSLTKKEDIKTNTKNNICYTTTEFFRDDFDWSGFCFYVNKVYKDTKKVNVICHACSTGEEAYSLGLKLKTLYEKKSNKFFPIIGKDIDNACIQKAKNGKYKINSQDERKIELETGPDLYRYMNIFDDGLEKYAFVRESLKDNLYFSQGELSEDVKNIPDKNTILLCRNFWGYLPAEEQISLAKDLGKKMDNSSLVVIGEFDKVYGVDKLLKQNGFEETEIKYVMRKKACLNNSSN